MTNTAKRIISLVTLACFVMTQSISANPGAGIDLVRRTETPSFLQIDIPSELATLDGLFEAQGRTDPKLILHIQNAHANFGAQQKIKQLLQYLEKTYAFKTIFVEGASEDLNPDYLKMFPDKERNARLAKYLAEQGELTGAEMYLLEADSATRNAQRATEKSDSLSVERRALSAPKAHGIEQAALYRENYEALKIVFGAEKTVNRYLGGFESRLDGLASKVFSPDLRKMLAEWKKFEKGHREFMPYIKNLAAAAKRVLGEDLESLFAQVQWPQITRLLVLQMLEKDLDTEKGLAEKTALVQFLKDKHVSGKLIKAIENFQDQRVTVLQSSTSGQAAPVQPRDLMEQLATEAGPKGFRFSDYPHFSLYAGYLILKNELDPKSLFEEIRTLFTHILDKLAANDSAADSIPLSQRGNKGDLKKISPGPSFEKRGGDSLQKELLELYRDEELVRKLLNLELTRKNWQEALTRRDMLEPSVMVGKLKEMNQKAKGLGTRTSGLKKKQGVAPRDSGLGKTRNQNESLVPSPESRSSKFRTEVVAAQNAAYDFYDAARKREDVFYQKIDEVLTKSGERKAVVITGGFHTDGITEILREHEVSYGILTPRLSEKSDEHLYRSVMLQNRPSTFELSYLEGTSRLISFAGQEAQLGSVVFDALKPVLRAIGYAGSLTSVDAAIEWFNQSDFAKESGIRIVKQGPNAYTVVLETKSPGSELFALDYQIQDVVDRLAQPLPSSDPVVMAASARVAIQLAQVAKTTAGQMEAKAPASAPEKVEAFLNAEAKKAGVTTGEFAATVRALRSENRGAPEKVQSPDARIASPSKAATTAPVEIFPASGSVADKSAAAAMLEAMNIAVESSAAPTPGQGRPETSSPVSPNSEPAANLSGQDARPENRDVAEIQPARAEQRVTPLAGTASGDRGDLAVIPEQTPGVQSPTLVVAQSKPGADPDASTEEPGLMRRLWNRYGYLMRSALMPAVLALGFARPNFAAGETPDSYSLRLDPTMSMNAGAENLSSAYAALDDFVINPLAESIYLEDSVVGRSVKFFALDLPASQFFWVLQHEVFGHGAKSREFGDYGSSYRMGFNVPRLGEASGYRVFGLWSGTASRGREYTLDESLEAEAGGMESTQVLARRIREDMYRNGVTYQDLLLYYFNKINLTDYILLTPSPGSRTGKIMRGGAQSDVDAYLGDMAAKYGEASTTGLSGDMRDAAKWNIFFDPTLYLAVFDAVRYVATGEDDLALPRILPYTGAGLTPIGPRFDGGLLFTIGDLNYDLHANQIRGPEANSYGAGLRIGEFRLGDKHSLALEFDLWRQEREPGGAIGMQLNRSVGENVSVSLGISAKTQGYLQAEPSAAGVTGFIGVKIGGTSRQEARGRSEVRVKFEDSLLEALPADEQARIETGVRFLKHVAPLYRYDIADVFEVPDFGPVPFASIKAAHDERHGIGHLIPRALEVLGEAHPDFSGHKISQQYTGRVSYEAHLRGIDLDHDMKKRSDIFYASVTGLLDYLFYAKGFDEEADFEKRARMVAHRIVAQYENGEEFDGQRFGGGKAVYVLDRIALTAEKDPDSRDGRLAAQFLSYFVASLFDQEMMHYQFAAIQALTEGFLNPEYLKSHNTGIFFMLNGATYLYESAVAVAKARGLDATRIHPIYLTRRIAESPLRVPYVMEEMAGKGYDEIVIVDTVVDKGTTLKGIFGAIGEAEYDPSKIHVRTLLVSDGVLSAFESGSMTFYAMTHVMGGRGLKILEDFENPDLSVYSARQKQVGMIAKCLDEIFPYRYRSPAHLIREDRKVRPELVPSDLPIFAGIVEREMEAGTRKLLQMPLPDFPHLEPGKALSIWKKWAGDGIENTSFYRNLNTETARQEARAEGKDRPLRSETRSELRPIATPSLIREFVGGMALDKGSMIRGASFENYFPDEAPGIVVKVLVSENARTPEQIAVWEEYLGFLKQTMGGMFAPFIFARDVRVNMIGDDGQPIAVMAPLVVIQKRLRPAKTDEAWDKLLSPLQANEFNGLFYTDAVRSYQTGVDAETGKVLLVDLGNPNEKYKEVWASYQERTGAIATFVADPAIPGLSRAETRQNVIEQVPVTSPSETESSRLGDSSVAVSGTPATTPAEPSTPAETRAKNRLTSSAGTASGHVDTDRTRSENRVRVGARDLEKMPEIKKDKDGICFSWEGISTSGEPKGGIFVDALRERLAAPSAGNKVLEGDGASLFVVPGLWDAYRRKFSESALGKTGTPPEILIYVDRTNGNVFMDSDMFEVMRGDEYRISLLLHAGRAGKEKMYAKNYFWLGSDPVSNMTDEFWKTLWEIAVFYQLRTHKEEILKKVRERGLFSMMQKPGFLEQVQLFFERFGYDYYIDASNPTEAEGASVAARKGLPYVEQDLESLMANFYRDETNIPTLFRSGDQVFIQAHGIVNNQGDYCVSLRENGEERVIPWSYYLEALQKMGFKKVLLLSCNRHNGRLLVPPGMEVMYPTSIAVKKWAAERIYANSAVVQGGSHGVLKQSFASKLLSGKNGHYVAFKKAIEGAGVTVGFLLAVVLLVPAFVMAIKDYIASKEVKAEEKPPALASFSTIKRMEFDWAAFATNVLRAYEDRNAIRIKGGDFTRGERAVFLDVARKTAGEHMERYVVEGVDVHILRNFYSRFADALMARLGYTKKRALKTIDIVLFFDEQKRVVYIPNSEDEASIDPFTKSARPDAIKVIADFANVRFGHVPRNEAVDERFYGLMQDWYRFMADPDSFSGPAQETPSARSDVRAETRSELRAGPEAENMDRIVPQVAARPKQARAGWLPRIALGLMLAGLSVSALAGGVSGKTAERAPAAVSLPSTQITAQAEKLLARSNLSAKEYATLRNWDPYSEIIFGDDDYERFLGHVPTAAEKAYLSEILRYGLEVDPEGFGEIIGWLKGVILLENSRHGEDNGHGYKLAVPDGKGGVVLFDFEGNIPAVTLDNRVNLLLFFVHEAIHANGGDEIAARQGTIDFVKRTGLDKSNPGLGRWMDQEQFMVDAAGLETQGEEGLKNKGKGPVWSYYWAMPGGSTEAWAMAPYTGATILAPGASYAGLDPKPGAEGSYTIHMTRPDGNRESFDYKRDGDGWIMDGKKQGPLTIQRDDDGMPAFNLNGKDLRMIMKTRSEARLTDAGQMQVSSLVTDIAVGAGAGVLLLGGMAAVLAGALTGLGLPLIISGAWVAVLGILGGGGYALFRIFGQEAMQTQTSSESPEYLSPGLDGSALRPIADFIQSPSAASLPTTYADATQGMLVPSSPADAKSWLFSSQPPSWVREFGWKLHIDLTGPYAGNNFLAVRNVIQKIGQGHIFFKCAKSEALGNSLGGTQRGKWVTVYMDERAVRLVLAYVPGLKNALASLKKEGRVEDAEVASFVLGLLLDAAFYSKGIPRAENPAFDPEGRGGDKELPGTWTHRVGYRHGGFNTDQLFAKGIGWFKDGRAGYKHPRLGLTLSGYQAPFYWRGAGKPILAAGLQKLGIATRSETRMHPLKALAAVVAEYAVWGAVGLTMGAGGVIASLVIVGAIDFAELISKRPLFTRAREGDKQGAFWLKVRYSAAALFFAIAGVATGGGLAGAVIGLISGPGLYFLSDLLYDLRGIDTRGDLRDGIIDAVAGRPDLVRSSPVPMIGGTSLLSALTRQSGRSEARLTDVGQARSEPWYQKVWDRLTGRKAPAPADIKPIVSHFVDVFSDEQLTFDEVLSLDFLPRQELFPKDGSGRPRQLTRQEIAQILKRTAQAFDESLVPGLRMDDAYRTVMKGEWERLETVFLNRASDDAVPFDLISNAKWIGLYMFLLDQKLETEFPDHKLVVLARDGLIKPVSDFNRNARAIYWPGQSRFTAEAKKDPFVTVREVVNAQAQILLERIVNDTAWITDLETRRMEIQYRFMKQFEELQADPQIGKSIEQFAEIIRDQASGQGLKDGDPIVLYDTWGSGKSVLSVAAVLRMRFPASDIQVIIGFNGLSDGYPSLARAAGFQEGRSTELIWPYEFLRLDHNGRPVFERKDSPYLLRSIAMALTAYNVSVVKDELRSRLTRLIADGKLQSVEGRGFDDVAFEYIFPDDSRIRHASRTSVARAEARVGERTVAEEKERGDRALRTIRAYSLAATGTSAILWGLGFFVLAGTIATVVTAVGAMAGVMVGVLYSATWLTQIIGSLIDRIDAKAPRRELSPEIGFGSGSRDLSPEAERALGTYRQGAPSLLPQAFRVAAFDSSAQPSPWNRFMSPIFTIAISMVAIFSEMYQLSQIKFFYDASLGGQSVVVALAAFLTVVVYTGIMNLILASLYRVGSQPLYRGVYGRPDQIIQSLKEGDKDASLDVSEIDKGIGLWETLGHFAGRRNPKVRSATPQKGWAEHYTRYSAYGQKTSGLKMLGRVLREIFGRRLMKSQRYKIAGTPAEVARVLDELSARGDGIQGSVGLLETVRPTGKGYSVGNVRLMYWNPIGSHIEAAVVGAIQPDQMDAVEVYIEASLNEHLGLRTENVSLEGEAYEIVWNDQNQIMSIYRTGPSWRAGVLLPGKGDYEAVVQMLNLQGRDIPVRSEIQARSEAREDGEDVEPDVKTGERAGVGDRIPGEAPAADVGPVISGPEQPALRGGDLLNQRDAGIALNPDPGIAFNPANFFGFAAFDERDLHIGQEWVREQFENINFDALLNLQFLAIQVRTRLNDYEDRMAGRIAAGGWFSRFLFLPLKAFQEISLRTEMWEKGVSAAAFILTRMLIHVISIFLGFSKLLFFSGMSAHIFAGFCNVAAGPRLNNALGHYAGSKALLETPIHNAVRRMIEVFSGLSGGSPAIIREKARLIEAAIKLLEVAPSEKLSGDLFRLTAQWLPTVPRDGAIAMGVAYPVTRLLDQFRRSVLSEKESDSELSQRFSEYMEWLFSVLEETEAVSEEDRFVQVQILRDAGNFLKSVRENTSIESFQEIDMKTFEARLARLSLRLLGSDDGSETVPALYRRGLVISSVKEIPPEVLTEVPEDLGAAVMNLVRGLRRARPTESKEAMMVANAEDEFIGKACSKVPGLMERIHPILQSEDRASFIDHVLVPFVLTDPEHNLSKALAMAGFSSVWSEGFTEAEAARFFKSLSSAILGPSVISREFAKYLLGVKDSLIGNGIAAVLQASRNDPEKVDKFVEFAREQGRDLQEGLEFLTIEGLLSPEYEVFLNEFLRNRDTSFLDIVIEIKEYGLFKNKKLKDLVAALMKVDRRDYRAARDAMALIVHVFSVAAGSKLDVKQALSKCQELVSRFVQRTADAESADSIGQRKIISELEAMNADYAARALSKLLGKSFSGRVLARFKDDPRLISQLNNLIGVYYRIRPEFPEVCKKIRQVLLRLKKTDRLADLNDWLFTRAPWNQGVYEALTKPDAEGRRLYDPRLWSEGYSKTVPAQSVTDPQKVKAGKIARIAQDLLAIARNHGVDPETGEFAEVAGLDSLTSVDRFIKLLLGRAPDLNAGELMDIQRIRRDVEGIEGQPVVKAEGAVVRVEVDQDFFKDTFSGKGVKGCYNPLTGSNRHMPLVHALETDALFLRVYSGDKMIGNAVLFLTPQGVVVQPLYDNGSISVDLHAAVFDVLADLVQKKWVPKVLFEASSAGYPAAQGHVQPEDIESSKSHNIVGDDELYAMDFGTPGSISTKYSATPGSLQGYVPAGEVRDLTAGEKAEKKKRPGADLKRAAQQMLFALSAEDPRFSDVVWGPVLQKIGRGGDSDHNILSLDEEGIRKYVSELKLRSRSSAGTKKGADQPAVVLDQTMQARVVDVLLKLKSDFGIARAEVRRVSVGDGGRDETRMEARSEARAAAQAVGLSPWKRWWTRMIALGIVMWSLARPALAGFAPSIQYESENRDLRVGIEWRVPLGAGSKSEKAARRYSRDAGEPTVLDSWWKRGAMLAVVAGGTALVSKMQDDPEMDKSMYWSMANSALVGLLSAAKNPGESYLDNLLMTLGTGLGKHATELWMAERIGEDHYDVALASLARSGFLSAEKSIASGEPVGSSYEHVFGPAVLRFDQYGFKALYQLSPVAGMVDAIQNGGKLLWEESLMMQSPVFEVSEVPHGYLGLSSGGVIQMKSADVRTPEGRRYGKDGPYWWSVLAHERIHENDFEDKALWGRLLLPDEWAQRFESYGYYPYADVGRLLALPIKHFEKGSGITHDSQFWEKRPIMVQRYVQRRLAGKAGSREATQESSISSALGNRDALPTGLMGPTDVAVWSSESNSWIILSEAQAGQYGYSNGDTIGEPAGREERDIREDGVQDETIVSPDSRPETQARSEAREDGEDVEPDVKAGERADAGDRIPGEAPAADVDPVISGPEQPVVRTDAQNEGPWGSNWGKFLEPAYFVLTTPQGRDMFLGFSAMILSDIGDGSGDNVPHSTRLEWLAESVRTDPRLAQAFDLKDRGEAIFAILNFLNQYAEEHIKAYDYRSEYIADYWAGRLVKYSERIASGKALEYKFLAPVKNTMPWPSAWDNDLRLAYDALSTLEGKDLLLEYAAMIISDPGFGTGSRISHSSRIKWLSKSVSSNLRLAQAFDLRDRRKAIAAIGVLLEEYAKGYFEQKDFDREFIAGYWKHLLNKYAGQRASGEPLENKFLPPDVHQEARAETRTRSAAQALDVAGARNADVTRELERLLSEIGSYDPDPSGTGRFAGRMEVIRSVAEWAEEAHADQMRKDGVTPYFFHPIGVARQLMERYKDGLTLVSILLALCHDVREDRAVDYFELLKPGIETLVAKGLLSAAEYDNFRLGMRLLTLPNLKLDESFRDREHILQFLGEKDAALWRALKADIPGDPQGRAAWDRKVEDFEKRETVEAAAQRLYFDRMVHPDRYFPSKDGLAPLPVEQLLQIQRIKLEDARYNSNDLASLLPAGKPVSPSIQRVPGRVIGKIVRRMIPADGLVQNPDAVLEATDREAFIKDFETRLEDYQKGDYAADRARFEPLILASAAGQAELARLRSEVRTVLPGPHRAEVRAVELGEQELPEFLRRYKASYLFMGHGRKNQFKDPAAVERYVAGIVREMDAKWGKGRWLAIYGGDPADAENPDLGYVMQAMKKNHGVPLLAVKSEDDGISPESEFADFVHYYLRKLSPEGNTIRGGIWYGKPEGGTKVYLSDRFIGSGLAGVYALGGGQTALEEFQYAKRYEKKGKFELRYEPFETRNHPGEFGALHDWYVKQQGLAQEGVEESEPSASGSGGVTSDSVRAGIRAPSRSEILPEEAGDVYRAQKLAEALRGQPGFEKDEASLKLTSFMKFMKMRVNAQEDAAMQVARIVGGILDLSKADPQAAALRLHMLAVIIGANRTESVATVFKAQYKNSIFPTSAARGFVADFLDELPSEEEWQAVEALLVANPDQFWGWLLPVAPDDAFKERFAKFKTRSAVRDRLLVTSFNPESPSSVLESAVQKMFAKTQRKGSVGGVGNFKFVVMGNTAVLGNIGEGVPAAHLSRGKKEVIGKALRPVCSVVAATLSHMVLAGTEPDMKEDAPLLGKRGQYFFNKKALESLADTLRAEIRGLQSISQAA